MRDAESCAILEKVCAISLFTAQPFGLDFLRCWTCTFSVSTFTSTNENTIITLSQELVYRALNLPKEVQHAWGRALSNSKRGNASRSQYSRVRQAKVGRCKRPSPSSVCGGSKGLTKTIFYKATVLHWGRNGPEPVVEAAFQNFFEYIYSALVIFLSTLGKFLGLAPILTKIIYVFMGYLRVFFPPKEVPNVRTTQAQEAKA